MDNTAIEKIVELGKPNLVDHYGRVYTDKQLSVIKQPACNTLEFHTLDGLINTIKREYEDFDRFLLINVYDESTVIVYSSLHTFSDRMREKPYICNADVIDIPLNRPVDYETMMITLKSKFVETPELLALVKLLGSITEESSATASDDGFTQNVVVRKGIAMKENKPVKPIVKLKPYRTFNEVDQPESDFLVRLSEGGYVSLYMADGGAWMLEARKNVAKYLKEGLADLIDGGHIIVVE